MSDTRNTPWTLAAAALLAALALLPLPAAAEMAHNLQCYGNTRTKYFISELFSSESEDAKSRFRRAIARLGHEVPSYIDCSSNLRVEQNLAFRQRAIDTFKGEVIILDAASLAAADTPSARPSGAPATSKAEADPARKNRDPAQEQALRAAQDKMDKSVAVAVADALRTVRKAPAEPGCRTVERPPKVTAGYGPTRDQALSQAMARTNSCKVVTTHCLENTKTEFTKEGRPKVAGKFWDCRVSYSCGETQEVCASKPAGASKQ